MKGKEEDTWTPPVNGEWWKQPLWSNEEHIKHTPYSQADIHRYIALVKSLFTREWFIVNENHPAYQHLNGMMTTSLDFIGELGHNLSGIEKHELGSWPKRLKGSEFHQASLELSVFAQLKQNGFSVNRDAKTGNGNSNADICVDDNLFIECKHLEISSANRRITKFSTLFTQAIMEEFWFDKRFFIKNLQFVEDIENCYQENDSINGLISNLEQLTKKVCQHISRKVELHAWDTHIVEGIVQYTIVPKNEKDTFIGAYRGMPMNPIFDSNKFLVNAVYKAIQNGQISKNSPSIIVAQMEQWPDLHVAKQYLEIVLAEDAKFISVDGVILQKKTFASSGIVIDSVFAENELSNFKMCDNPAIQSILSLACCNRNL